MQAKLAHRGRLLAGEYRPSRQQRQRKHRGHRQPRRPHSVVLPVLRHRRRFLRRLHGLPFFRPAEPVRQDAGGPEPDKRSHEGDIVGTPGVIDPPVNPHIDGQRACGVTTRCAEQIGIDHSPAARSTQPVRSESGEEHHIFRDVEQIVVLPVKRDVGQYVSPGNDHEQVKIDPPERKQREIQITEAQAGLGLSLVRLQGKRGYHRDRMEKEDEVAGEGIGDRLMQVNLEVGPQQLRDHPQRTAERHQHPEGISAPVGRARVQQQAGIGKQRHHALRQVAVGGQPRARAKQQRDPGIAANKQNPGSQNPPRGERRAHERPKK